MIQKLRLIRCNYEQICKKIFTQRLTNEEVLSLSSTIINRLQFDPTLKQLSIEYVKIRSNTKEIKKPNELFEKNSQTESFFLDEMGRFPCENYNVNTLRSIGLKSIQNISLTEIKERINFVATTRYDSPPRRNIVTKVNAILTIIKQKGLSTHSFDWLPWIPVAEESPRADYPQKVHWHGKTMKNMLAKPDEVIETDHQYLVGSVKPIIHPDVLVTFMDCFQGTRCVNKQISFNDVMTHLKNVEKCFDSSNNKSDTKNMVMRIYDYISRNSPQFVQWWTANSTRSFNLWHGNGFAPHNKVIFIKGDTNLVDLSPHFYNIPDLVANKLSNILHNLPCQKCRLSVYKSTLEEIALDNDSRRTNPGVEDAVRDTNLSILLVEMLAKDFSQEVENMRSSIFVPIESPTLFLVPLDTCHYLDFEDKEKFTTSSSSRILHRRLGKDIAKTLDVPNYAAKVFKGGKKNIFKPWGQKQPPLTKNLKSILEGYQDGLAIIKELIQNADDAEATEVSILYDRRPNENYKTSLINPELKEWQGPALWVYNNKKFTEADFNNITKLNAETKRSEATKIGKFGLGFNAVYHLTDVPSILSDDSLVIFDPHFRYLEDIVDKREPVSYTHLTLPTKA